MQIIIIVVTMLERSNIERERTVGSADWNFTFISVKLYGRLPISPTTRTTGKPPRLQFIWHCEIKRDCHESYQSSRVSACSSVFFRRRRSAVQRPLAPSGPGPYPPQPQRRCINECHAVRLQAHLFAPLRFPPNALELSTQLLGP